MNIHMGMERFLLLFAANHKECFKKRVLMHALFLEEIE